MYAVETKELSKSFNGFKAVDSLSLKVPEGSIYGFLGPNGAGKTTTIKMLTGLSEPTSGEIKICGRPVSFGSVKNRDKVGYLPDVPAFYDWMTAEEFLMFTGRLFGINTEMLKKRLDGLLELVGLIEVKKKIGSYSRGMKQRLGIAQALINEPQVVFLDEPTSALDPIGRKEVMDIVARLSGKVTVFFSTHILSDVERVCDRVVILDKGKMLIEDSIASLRNRYSRRCVVMELEEAGEAVKLLEALSNRRWVERAPEIENGEIRIYVGDMAKAQLEIPEILHANGLALRKFIIQEPSLEDIFLKVVNE